MCVCGPHGPESIVLDPEPDKIDHDIPHKIASQHDNVVIGTTKRADQDVRREVYLSGPALAEFGNAT